MVTTRTIYEKAVLLDTSAIVALRNPSDSYHRFAESCILELKKNKYPIYISNVTIFETHKRILFDMGYYQALNFLMDIYSGETEILRIMEDDEYEAKRIITKFSDQTFSFVDSLNFSVMKKYGISQAFTFDRHYEVFGFIKIPSTV